MTLSEWPTQSVRDRIADLHVIAERADQTGDDDEAES